MCLNTTPIRNLTRWNWGGDRIIHECIVPSSRPVVGYSKGHSYDIDVREFLITGKNEIIGKTLNQDIRSFLTKSPGGWELFQSREPRAFDYRTSVITSFVAERITYLTTRGQDPWQFPDETLALKKGDCEDRALLIASLLIASGISAYNVRVTLGKMRIWDSTGNAYDQDHVWVMYKTESGQWRIIEPLPKQSTSKPQTRPPKFQHVSAAEYIPYFVFNDTHLWQIRHEEHAGCDEKVKLKRDWSELHPSFAGIVHQDIMQQALAIPACPQHIRDALRNYFSPAVGGLFGPIVDKIDRDLSEYNPVDHFDNGLIQEGWAAVNQRLTAFKQDHGNIDAFARAAHAIGDFYAHSSFTHFSNNNQPCDPQLQNCGLPSPPFYGAGSSFDLTGPEFSLNTNLWKRSKTLGAAAWDQHIISGRYSQAHDSRGPLEAFAKTVTGLTAPYGALPHHLEIAVDGDQERNRLYQDPARYLDQLHKRTQAATAHIRQAFLQSYTHQ